MLARACQAAHERRLAARGRAGPVVADAQSQAVVGVVQLHIDGGAWRVPTGVGESLLDDPVGGKLDTGVECGRRAVKDEAGSRPGRVPRSVDEVVQLAQSRLRVPVRGFDPGVLAQHAEQPPHLGQRGPGGVADVGQPLRTGGGHPRGGQAGCLRLHDDHRDVVGDDVVQLAGDASPFTARGVLEQRAGDDLPGGPVLNGLAARPPCDPGQGRRRGQRGQQHREDVDLGTSGAGECQHQVRRGENHGQQRRTVPAETIPGDELRRHCGHGQRLESCERQHARPGDGCGARSRLRPEESQRHHGSQGDQAEYQGVQHGSTRKRGGLRRTLSLRDRLSHREQPQQRASDDGSVRSCGDPPCPIGPTAMDVTHEAHVDHCRHWCGARRPPCQRSRVPRARDAALWMSLVPATAKIVPRRDDVSAAAE
jgi:hypothetical protein